MKVVKGWASYLLIASQIMVISVPAFVPFSKIVINFMSSSDCSLSYKDIMEILNLSKIQTLVMEPHNLIYPSPYQLSYITDPVRSMKPEAGLGSPDVLQWNCLHYNLT